MEYVDMTQEELTSLKQDAKRYRWLRDNKHLDIWWSVEGPEDRCDNIDADIDSAMIENKPVENNDDMYLTYGPYTAIAIKNTAESRGVYYLNLFGVSLDFITRSNSYDEIFDKFVDKVTAWEKSIIQRGESVKDYLKTNHEKVIEPKKEPERIRTKTLSAVTIETLDDYLASIPEYIEAMEDNLFGGREPWSVYFMRKAVLAGERTTCKSREVGAVFVRNKTDVMTGYNGVPPGYPHPSSCKRKDMGCKSGERLDLCPCNHAERNAINMAAGEGIRLYGTSVYVSTKPCVSCMGDCAVVGVKEIVYFNEYNHEISEEIANYANIKLVPLREKIVQEIIEKNSKT